MVAAALEVGNQSPLPLIDLAKILVVASPGWESVTSPFDRLSIVQQGVQVALGISHLSL